MSPSPLVLGDPHVIGLRPEQWGVTERVLREEDAARHHLVIAVSGAHAYGFPSPDSDIDLKAIHVAPTRALLSLSPKPGGRERLEVIDGVEIDFSANELGGVLAGVVSGNGNFVERILGQRLAAWRPELAELVPLVQRSLSRRIHRHYLGFASSQRREADAKPLASAKRLLYVLRTALTGVHVMKSGEVVADLGLLLDDYGFGDARDLIAAKTSGERSELGEADSARWRARVGEAMALLESVRDSGPLPESAPNVTELDDWLVELRRRHF